MTLPTFWRCSSCGKRHGLQTYQEHEACPCGGEIFEVRGYETLTLKGVTALGGRFNVAFEEHGFSATLSETREGDRIIAGDHEFHDALKALSTDKSQLLSEVFEQACVRSVMVIEERTSEGIRIVGLDEGSGPSGWEPYAEGIERRRVRYFPSR